MVGEGRSGFRSDIEGLRAVAVVSVILYHIRFPGAKGGYVGVDVFFVISGFLITTQLVRDAASSSGIRIRDFYARRIRRLLPAATVTILVTLIGAALIQSPVLQHNVAEDARSAALFFSNFHFIDQSRNYFNQGKAPSLFQHFWSLSVEEQFYVIWPTILIVSLAGATAVRRRVGIVLGVIIVVSVVAAVRLTDTNPAFAFYSLPTRAWELGIGASLAVGTEWLASRLSGAVRNALCLVGLAMIGVAVVHYSDATKFPGTAAILPVVGSALVIASGIGVMSTIGRVIVGWRPFELIGRYSYSLYLFHWPVLILATVKHPTIASNWQKGLVIVLFAVVPLALASYHLVEAPIRWNKRFRPPRAALPLGAGLIALSVFALLPFEASAGPTDAGKRATPVGDAIASSVSPTEFVPSNLTPKLLDATTGGFGTYPWTCPDAAECDYGDATAAKTVVLFGDSHAAQWLGAFFAAQKATGWRIVNYTAIGCSSFYTPSLVRFPGCPAFRERIYDRINALKPDLVVLTNHNVPFFRANPVTWETSVTKAIDRIDDGIPVAVLGQTPLAPGDVPACLGRHIHNPKPCEPVLPMQQVDAVNTELRRIVAAHGASFVDVIPWICSTDRCPAIIGNVLVYGDDDHITQVFGETRGQSLADALTPLLRAS